MKAPKLRCCPKCGSTDLRLKAVAETTWTFTQMPDGTFERSDITEPDYYETRNYFMCRDCYHEWPIRHATNRELDRTAAGTYETTQRHSVVAREPKAS